MTVRRVEQRTRSRILQAAFDIVCTYGFAGVTLGNLARQVGMSKSGLFAHFKSIEQVHLALVDYIGEVFQAEVTLPALGEAEGLPRLEATISHWLAWASRPIDLGGAPLLAGFFEFDDREGSVRDSLFEQGVRWCAQLQELVSQAIATGSLKEDLNIEQFVFELLGIYCSFHVSRRFMRNSRAQDFATTAVSDLINRARCQ